MTTDEFDPSSIDEDTFERLVETVIEIIREKYGPVSTDLERTEIIYTVLEDIPGFESQEAAERMAQRILAAIEEQLGS